MSSLREIEARSIESFVQSAANRGCFRGRVLDYGAGRQPYRKIVEDAGGSYHPYDRMSHPGSTVTTDVGDDNPLWTSLRVDPWDAILCTQVIQYVPSYMRKGQRDDYAYELLIDGVAELLEDMYHALAPGGRLVMTGPTNWPVVETQDLHRFTVEGIVHRLGLAGFPEVECHYRATIPKETENWSLGWGAIATKEQSS